MRALIVSTFVAALALAACGGKSAADAFRAEANAICRGQYAAFADSLGQVGYTEGDREAAVGEELRRGATVDATARLEELEAPKGLGDRFDRMLDARRRSTAAKADEIAAIRDGDTAGAEAADERAASAGDDATEAALDLGLEICGQELSGDAEAEVEETLEKGLVSDDPDVCAEVFTEAYVEEALGGEKACRDVPAGRLPDSIAVDEIRGVEDEFATARVTFEGGPSDGLVLGSRLVYEDGDPRIADGVLIDQP